ncbi:MAG: hypothetical protein AAF399_09620 [Bacteroidota bacterium]
MQYPLKFLARQPAQYFRKIHVKVVVDFVVRSANCVVDTRNMTKGITHSQDKIVRLGHTERRKKLIMEH